MRFKILKDDMDVESLASSLARIPRAAASVRKLLTELNSHLIKGNRIPKGSVVILPDGSDIKPGAGTKPSTNSLGEFSASFAASRRAAARLAAERLESQNAERTAVRNALKSAAAKRLVESDPSLRKQLAAAEAHFKAEQKRSSKLRDEMAKAAEALEKEAARLEKIFG